MDALIDELRGFFAQFRKAPATLGNAKEKATAAAEVLPRRRPSELYRAKMRQRAEMLGLEDDEIEAYLPAPSRPVVEPTRFVPANPLEKSLQAAAQKDGPVVAGFIRLAGISGIDELESPDEVQAQVNGILKDRILGNLTSKDVLQEVGDGEFLIHFGYGSIEGAEDTLKRMRSEIRTQVFRKLPDVDVIVDRHVQPLDPTVVETGTEAIYQQLRQSAPTLEQRAAVEDAAALQRGRSFFVPFWAPRSSQMSSNLLLLELPKDIASRVRSEDGAARNSARALVDREGAIRCIAHLRSHGMRTRPRVIVPVAVSTLLSNELAKPFVQVLAGAVDVCSHVSIEIQPTVEEGRDIERLATAAGLIATRKLGVEAILRLDMRDPTLPVRLVPSLNAISTTLPASRDPNELREHIARFKGLSNKTGLGTYACSADSIAQVRIAMQAGIDHISGQAVHALSDVPRSGPGASTLAYRVQSAA